MRALLTLAAPLAVLACSGVDAQEPYSSEPSRTISVSGTGIATATPDMAQMSFSVQTLGDTAGAATRANAERMTAVQEAMRRLGIEPRDLQTSGFGLFPRYAQNERGRTDTNRIIGYTANNSLTVRLRDIDDLGAAIDAAVNAGANNLNGLSFGFQNRDELIEEARRLAVRDARGLANLLAEEADVDLGPLLTMNMHSSRGGPQPVMMRSMEADSITVSGTPIEAGEASLSVTVNMVYSID